MKYCPVNDLSCPYCAPNCECRMKEITGDDPEMECDAFFDLNDCEPADIDDDCGFDPYEGCFTYDC